MPDMSQKALDSKRQCNSSSRTVDFDKDTEALYCSGNTHRILRDEYLELGSQCNADLRCIVVLEIRFEKFSF